MKILFLFTCLLFTTMSRAQALKIMPGTDITILSGTMFKTDSLTITPSIDFTIGENELIKSDTVTHITVNPYISRVYQYENNTNPFSGSVQIDYTDGAELNGIPEGSLTLNVHDGTSWSAYPVATRDGINNFVLTTGLSFINLHELTLADVLTPLPVAWLSFNATQQNKTALLEWATAQEQNTRSFSVQHSINGRNWSGIGALAASGNSIRVSNYSYVHKTPVTGINYYRILQTDMDNRGSYSNIQTLRFTTADEFFSIIGNPVTNNMLTIRTNTVTTLALYTAGGKLVWQEQVKAGTTYIDVSRYAKGIYLLKANSTTQKIMIQ